MAPARPAATDFPTDINKLKRFNGGEPTFDKVTTFFIDLLAQAFACDVTRFATLVFNDLPWDSPATRTTDSLGYGLARRPAQRGRAQVHHPRLQTGRTSSPARGRRPPGCRSRSTTSTSTARSLA